MKKFALKIIAACVFTVLFIFSESHFHYFQSIYEYTHSVHEKNGTYYYGLSVQPVSDGWYLVEHTNILFIHGGKSANGLKEVNNDLYYFNNGIAETGWKTLGDKTYYFLQDGKAAKGLQHIEGNLYCFQDDKSMRCGWYKFKDHMYYFLDDGKGAVGFQDIDNKTYYFNQYSIMSTGKCNIDGVNYEFSDDGVMKTGIQQLNDTIYCYADNGAQIKNDWYISHGKKYYFNEYGEAVNGWQTIDGNRYYFKDYHVVTCYQDIDGSQYFFDDDGVMQTGYIDNGDILQYFQENGTLLINGDIDEYEADENGNLKEKNTYSSNIDISGVDFSGTIGTEGRLIIPDVGVSVALYRSNGDNQQAITDRQDSAAYMLGWSMPYIGDHKNQGFSAINNCVPGQTLAFINYGDYYETYICTDSFTGYNDLYDLYDGNYNNIDGLYSGSFVTYTCLEHWTHVRICIFSPV